MMHYILLGITFILSFKGYGQSLQDGPYVFYRGDSILVRSVEQGKPTSDAFPIEDKGALDVLVNFPGHRGWDFWVRLKPALKNEPSEFRQPEKLFFVSDVEGEFEGFRALLIAGKVMDDKYNWNFGKGHMVICGDMFDRGEQVPECLWLVYKLEDEAKKSGGYVHLLLGNHDIMALSGDVRYVQPKYFASTKLMGLDYLRLYDSNTEMGRWLRTKNTVEKIGDNLCAHAGIAPQINKLGMKLKDINTKCRPYYDKARVLKGVGDPAIDTFFKGETSLFWYRGYFMEPKATEAEVDQTLGLYGVKRIVVGHTIVPGNVGFYYGRKVLGLDVDQHLQVHQAAVYEGGNWFKVNDKGERFPL